MVGQAYRINAGPLSGFWAEIEAALSPDRVRVLVKAFGGASAVDLPVDHLEAA
jgi:transcription antitermination factor NusG